MANELTLLERIERDALLFAAVESEDEREALRRMCAAAADGLSARLRPGVEPEDCAGFVQAAAWTAISFFAAGKRADGVTSFTAGELSVALGGKNAAAEALMMQAEILLAPYLRGNFAFMGVKG